MSTPRDPDAILAAWLDEGPHELPEPTRRAIAVATRSSHQTRHAAGLPWRSLPMNPFARIAIAVLALTVVIGGAVYLFRPGNQVGGGPPPVATASPAAPAAPSAAPSATANETATPMPTPIDTTAWIPFTSDRHGYSFDRPPDWSVVKSTRPWPFGSPGDVAGDGTVDEFDQPAPGVAHWLVSSQAIPKGTTEAAWFTAYLTGTESMPAGCFPPRTQWQSITIAGHPAAVHGGLPACGFTEAVAILGGRAYVFTGYPDRVAASGRIFDRTLFDDLLSTVSFQPTKADDTPVASPGPS
jgi:hypothetical protein